MTPRVSVIIATRARRECVGRALRSVLVNRDPRFDVWIVGTGPDGVADSLRPLLADPRVHCLQTEARGSARVHNEAIARTAGEILVITDDDCEVATDWIEEMIRAFDCDARIGIVFGNVHPAPLGDDSSHAYLRRDEFVARDLRDKARVEGIWCCMGVRRQTWEALGGFDERFGHGARFPGCADGDLAIRALAAGYFVFETPRVSVSTHRALPPEEQWRAVEGYTYASGALIGTHLRRRTPGILRLISTLAWRWAIGTSHPALGLRGGSHRWRRLSAFLRGVARGAAA